MAATVHSMNDWLKIIVPIVLTGSGIMMYSLFTEIHRIEDKLLEGDLVIYRIEQLEIKVKELQRNK